jgi:hypothetical protein
LGLVSTAQLAAGVTGMAVAVKRRHPYNVPTMHGSPDTVARDTVLMGTAFSAPLYMLAAQGLASRRALAAPSTTAERVLGGLGLAMIAGYLGEQLVRERLRPSGYDALETPLVVAGVALSVAMARLGLTRRR